ncbi:MAG: hypothetical protein HYS32_02590 [Candidatus Woesearchaeota archaeon]|nr:MAG: hypothetical protein HYS32_02590 [Candidatus Woesearchaeota archaeon]
MPIVDFVFTKVTAEKTADIKEMPKFSNKTNVTNLELVQIPTTPPRDLLKADFSFEVEFINVGKIELLGYLSYTDDPKKIKEIMEKWKKDKKMDPDFSTHIINFILLKCNIKALSLEQELNLPPHLQLPFLQKKSK